VGIERIGFLTLTFKDKIYDIEEASRQFNSLNRRVLKEYFGGWYRVIEQHQAARALPFAGRDAVRYSHGV